MASKKSTKKTTSKKTTAKAKTTRATSTKAKDTKQPSAEELEQRRKAQAEKAGEMLRKLERAVAAVKTSEQWTAYMRFISKFHGYSLTNLMLIAIQFPDATQVAGFTTWKKLGRSVKAGEKGIAIWCPRPIKLERKNDAGDAEDAIEMRFRIGYVFDISQTEGPEIPEPIIAPVLTSDAGDEAWERLVGYAETRGLAVSTDIPASWPKSRMGQINLRTKHVLIRPGARSMMVKTLAHEIAHDIDPLVFKGPPEEAEVTAESTAFVVCAHFGIDSEIRSAPYVATWSQQDKGGETIKRVMERVKRIAQEIIAGADVLGDPVALED